MGTVLLPLHTQKEAFYFILFYCFFGMVEKAGAESKGGNEF